jgi:hypothetical protein
MFDAFMLHILLCDELFPYFHLQIEVIRRSNWIWIQIGLQIKKNGIEKAFFIKGHGPNPASTLKLAHQAEALPGPGALLYFRGDRGIAAHRAQTPGHCTALPPYPQGRCHALLRRCPHAVPTLDTSAITDFRWKSKPNQTNLGEIR